MITNLLRSLNSTREMYWITYTPKKNPNTQNPKETKETNNSYEKATSGQFNRITSKEKYLDRFITQHTLSII